MDIRINRALPAALAGAAVAVFGCLGAGAAPAAAQAGRWAAGPVFSSHFAGYRAGSGTSWRFRWATTTVRVFSCATAAAQHGWAVNGTGIGAGSPRWVAEAGAGCATRAGGAVESLLVVNGHRSVRLLRLRTFAGDRVTLSVYYDRRAGEIRFGAVDWGTHHRAVRWVPVGTGINYRGAGAGSVFTGRVTAPGVTIRTGTFTGTHLTSYSGHRGTLLGAWPTNPVIATTTGTRHGRLIAHPSLLRDFGTAFTVWEQAHA